MKALVLGANGFIGSKLVQFLLERRVNVRVLSRKGMKVVHPGVEVIIGNLVGNDVSHMGLITGCDVVFNCAGEVRDEGLMHGLHVQATAKLLDAVSAYTAQGKSLHWVQLSSVGAYGPSNGKPRVVSEQTPTSPVGTYEITKTLADDLIIAHKTSSLFTYTILRPSNVFGPTMSNNSLRQLGSMVKRKRFFFVGYSPAVATYIHVEDVVSALYLCGTDPQAKGQVFNLSNDCMLPELIGGMASALGVPRPRLVVPEYLVRLGVMMVSRISNMPITQKRVDALVDRTRYPADKISAVLGYAPKRRVDESIAELFR